MSLECIFCNSDDCVKRGKRRNKTIVKQRYICNKCGRQFVKRDGFEKMRHRPVVIDNVKVTRRTISQWEKKYSNF